MPAAALPLVPYPRTVRPKNGAPFRLTPDAAVTGPADAVADLIEAIAARTGIRLTARADARINLDVDGHGAPESYRLRVDERAVRITGADAAGLAHGIRTLVQLLAAGNAGWTLPAIQIEDAPRFTHRGLMLDVARHFFPVEVVTRLIDHAAALKLNVLHLHLSDDQGWRLALSSRPELVERAAGTSVGGDPGGHYTAADYRAIIAHATRRHMTVIPEFDGPGHTHAVGLAYPELAAAPTITPGVLDAVREFGGGTPAAGTPYTGIAVGFSSLRIGTPEVAAFLADVFGELATMTPGPYLHIGGDEAHGTADADYAAYIAEVTRLVTDLGKVPVAWHEAGAAAAPGTIGQYWGFVHDVTGTAEAAETTARLRGFVRGGERVILSPADAVYLDMKPRADSPLGLTWANGPTSVERSYRWEPSRAVPGVRESDILGVEAALWTETIRTREDVDAMVFPRLASAAEIGWSPAEAPERTWDGFRTRLAGLGPGWTAAGIGFDRSPEIPWGEA